MTATLVSSRKIGGRWVDAAPGIGTPFKDCHNVTVRVPSWWEETPGRCHKFECVEVQKRCFDGRMTLQKYVEIFEDTYEDHDSETTAAKTGAYTSAGGAGILGAVGLYTFFASNPIGWVVGAGTVIGTLLTGGGTALWVESPRFVTRYTRLREQDSGLTRTGFSGKYSVEILDASVAGDPDAEVECESIPADVRRAYGATLPAQCRAQKGKKASADDYVCDEGFARGP